MAKLMPVRRTSCRMLAPYCLASRSMSLRRSRLYSCKSVVCLSPKVFDKNSFTSSSVKFTFPSSKSRICVTACLSPCYLDFFCCLHQFDIEHTENHFVHDSIKIVFLHKRHSTYSHFSIGLMVFPVLDEMT